MENILNNKFINLDELSTKYHQQYLNNKPFSHIVFDNFFNTLFLEKILEDFPKNLEKTGIKFEDKQEKKIASKNPDIISNNTNTLINFLNSYKFLNFLNNLSGMQETLIPDPYLWGGGYHELKNGGYLNIHADFNIHPQLELNRRINLLIYLNKNWKDEYGGHLELWDKMMTKCEKKISPIFNRMVVFSTNDFSYHGHPEPVICPMGESRKSIALYYFSKGRPSFEIDVSKIKNQTYFEDRHGFKNETENQSKGFKNFLRSLKFYQSMKRFEKKYLRKK